MSKINILVLLLMPSMMEYSPIPDHKIYEAANNTIDFTNQNLTYISIDEINQLNASVLDYSNNYLKFSLDDVKQLYKYRYRMAILEIILNNNCIENMPDLCDALPNLMIIDLRYNNIRSLRKEQLLCFKNLSVVWLGNNPLEDRELKNLKTVLSHINFTSPKLSNNNGVLSIKSCDIITESTSNDTVSTPTSVEDDVTSSNAKKESAKTTETTNSASEEITITKSDVFLSSDSSKTTEENHTVSTATPVEDADTASNTKEETTKSRKSASEETSKTKSNSHSTTPANRIHNNSTKITEENHDIWFKLICIALGGVGFGCLIIYIILCYHQKGKESKKELEETENEEYFASVEQLLSRKV